MAHVRSTLRTAVLAACIAAATPAASRWYKENPYTVERADLPCGWINVDTESVDVISYGGGPAGRQVERQLNLKVSYSVSAIAGYQDAVDDAFALIEPALATLIAPNMQDILLAGMEFVADTEGEAPLYTATATYLITYLTTLGNPSRAP